MLFERLPVIRALHVLVLLSLTVVFPSYADRAVRQYAAKVETSSWTLDPQSNRLECRLIHHIDRFGVIETDGLNELSNPFEAQLQHPSRGICCHKEFGGGFIHRDIRGLCREHHRDEQLKGRCPGELCGGFGIG